MKFGLVYEIAVPYPSDPELDRRTFENCLAQVKLADALGFDQVWAVEHHFLRHQSYSSAPEIFLTACAMATERIRLGHGIVICVPEVNHPVRIAERAAFLDHLSAGRVELGTGRAATWMELSGFGASVDDTKKSWDEFVRAIPRMWTQERYAHQGESFSMPERAVLPSPYQDPHPPLWVAVTSPGTELDAAERGLGCLIVSFGTMAETERRVSEYRRRIQTCDPVGATVNEQVNIIDFLYCHENNDYAVEVGQRMMRRYTGIAGQYLSAKEAVPTASYATNALLPGLRPEGAPRGRREPEGLTLGDPHHLIAALRQWEATGVDRVCFLVDRQDVLPHEDVMASLRLFAREVMPAFA